MLNGIGVLIAVVETKTFGRAATSLGLTQSGVSRAILRLEELVGARLLQRSARAVTLTDEGRRFYESVAPLMTGIEEAASDAAGSTEKPKGLLRVSIDTVVARVELGPKISVFLAENPALSVDLVVRDSLGDLVADGFDVAIRFGEPDVHAHSALIVKKLADTRVLTVASPGYIARRGRPKHPRDIADHECILFRDPSTGRPYDWIFQRGKKTIKVEARGRLIANDSSAALAACMAGHGIAQPLEAQLRAFRDHGLVDLLPEWGDERFALHAYYPSRRHTPAKVRALIDFIARNASALEQSKKSR